MPAEQADYLDLFDKDYRYINRHPFFVLRNSEGQPIFDGHPKNVETIGVSDHTIRFVDIPAARGDSFYFYLQEAPVKKLKGTEISKSEFDEYRNFTPRNPYMPNELDHIQLIIGTAYTGDRLRFVSHGNRSWWGYRHEPGALNFDRYYYWQLTDEKDEQVRIASSTHDGSWNILNNTIRIEEMAGLFSPIDTTLCIDNGKILLISDTVIRDWRWDQRDSFPPSLPG